MELYIDLNPKDYFRCSMYYMRKFFGIREIILLTILFVVGMVLFIFADNIFMLILFAVSVGIILIALVLFLITAKGGYKVDMEKQGIVKQKLEFTEDAILATSFDKKGNPIFVETHPNEKIDKIAITKKAIYIYAQASVFYYIVAANYDDDTRINLVEFLHSHFPENTFKMKKTIRSLPKKKKLTLE